MPMLKTLAVAAAVICASATAVSAAPITFNFGAGSNTENTHMLSESGLDLTITGYTGFDGTVFAGGGGLGTLSDINRNGSGWAIGGGLTQPGEALNYDFGTETVVLQSLTVFELDGTSDTLTIWNGTTSVANVLLPADPGADTFGISLATFATAAAATGSNFTVSTDSGAIRVASLVVEVVDIPAPASALLLSTGLAGLALSRRRRR